MQKNGTSGMGRDSPGDVLGGKEGLGHGDPQQGADRVQAHPAGVHVLEAVEQRGDEEASKEENLKADDEPPVSAAGAQGAG